MQSRILTVSRANTPMGLKLSLYSPVQSTFLWWPSHRPAPVTRAFLPRAGRPRTSPRLTRAWTHLTRSQPQRPPRAVAKITPWLPAA